MTDSQPDSKATYRELVNAEASVPLFSRDWWLDATAGEANWDVSLAVSSGRIVGALPFEIGRSGPFRRLGQPQLTPHTGPWLRSSTAKQEGVLEYEKDVMDALIANLPEHAIYSQAWHRNVSNWLPFYWHGFRATTRYTYVLRDLEDEERIWEGFRRDIRNKVRKARDKVGLAAHRDDDIEALIAMNRLTFRHQSIDPPYPDDLVRTLYRASKARDRGTVFVVRDEGGRPHAAMFVVWDDEALHCLVGGSDPDLRSTGAMSLCVWEVIRFARTVAPTFDFEGSMLEPVERFNRAFGAVQAPYFHVSRVRSRRLALAMAARDALHAVRSRP